MPIRRFAVARLRMPLSHPYTIAYETVVAAENILVRVEDERGRAGFGVAAPDEAVTGESLGSAAEVLERLGRPHVCSSDTGRIARLASTLERLAPEAPAARAAIEMAVWDLLGKQAGMPLYRLLGGYRSRILTSITIGISGLETTLIEARARVAQGFRAL